MQPILFSLSGIHFYTFGAFLALGVLIGGLIVTVLSQYEHLKIRSIFDAVMGTVIFGLLVARISYYLLYLDNFESFWQMLHFWQDGLIAYMGIAGGSLFVIYYFTRQKENPWKWMDIFILGFYAAWILAYLGQYLSRSSSDEYICGIPLPIWEIGCLILVGGVLAFIWRRKILLEGMLFMSGISLFAMERFVADFWGNADKVLGFLTLNQTSSLAVLIICLMIISWLKDIIHPNILAHLKLAITRRIG